MLKRPTEAQALNRVERDKRKEPSTLGGVGLPTVVKSPSVPKGTGKGSSHA